MIDKKGMENHEKDPQKAGTRFYQAVGTGAFGNKKVYGKTAECCSYGFVRAVSGGSYWAGESD
jgi:hypothetical protein